MVIVNENRVDFEITRILDAGRGKCLEYKVRKEEAKYTLTKDSSNLMFPDQDPLKAPWDAFESLRLAFFIEKSHADVFSKDKNA